MSDRELRQALLNALYGQLSPIGFALNRGEASFKRRNKEGWHEFQLIFLSRRPGWDIKLGLMIRKNIVENLYHKASYFEPKYHKTTPTIGISVENYIDDGNEYCYSLYTISDITKCYFEISKVFSDIAEPFFARFDKIENIEKEVNIESRKSIFTGPKYEGNVGIILAKLVKNPNYEQLKTKYQNYYEWLSNGFYLPEYNAVVEELKKI